MIRKLATLIFGLVIVSSTALAEDPQPFSVKARATWGPFGPPRSSPIVAGDSMFFTSTFDGLSHDGDGFFDFTSSSEILDPNGKVVQSTKPFQARRENQTTTISFPSSCATTPDLKPGVYVRVVRATDNISGKTATAETRIQLVEPKGVSIFDLHCGQAAKGSFPIRGATVVVGDALTATWVIANFVTDDSEMRCNVAVSILDTDGQPVKWGTKVNSGKMERTRSRYDSSNREDVSFEINAVRPGKFILCIHIEDLIGKTETTEYLPLQVLDPPDWSMPKIAQKKQNSEKKLNR